MPRTVSAGHPVPPLPAGSYSHETAGRAHGLWLPYPVDARRHITGDGPERSDAALRVHKARLDERDVALVAGERHTSIARTALDLARGRPFPQALVPLDSAYRTLVLRQDLTPHGLRYADDGEPFLLRLLDDARAEIEDAFSRMRGWPGTRVVQRCLSVMEARPESPYESWSRGCVLQAQLPRPRVGALLRGASGATYFADMLWEQQRLIGEADGVAKLGTNPDQVGARLEAERVRQRDLEDAGWRFVRWNSGERPDRFTARIGRALRSG